MTGLADAWAGVGGSAEARRKLAIELMRGGIDTSPVQSPLQGAGRLAQALLAGLELNSLDKQDKEFGAALTNLPGLGGAAPSPDPKKIAGVLSPSSPPEGYSSSDERFAPIGPPSIPKPATMPATDKPAGVSANPMGTPNFGNAIASIESGGRYDILGPVTKTGDRAYGKYQVMGANVGPWTEQYLGRRMTPQEFLSDPKAQDAVFNARFGEYANKYGPEGAARAWFAGERGMNNLNARDQLGTRVADYGKRFTAALGPQTVSLAPAANPPPAAPSQSAASPAPVQVAQAGQPTPGRAEVSIPPQIAAQIRQYLGSNNPQIRALGVQLYQQYAKPPSYDKLNDDTLYDKATGNTKPVGPGYRPLTDPADRARYGIPKEDNRPYQVGPANKLVNPPAETRFTVEQRGESEFSKAVAKNQADRFDKIAQGGMEAKSMVAAVQNLREIGGRITTGKTAEIQAAIGPYAEMLGIKIDGLDDMQAYKAIVAKLTPQMRIPGSGATSDFEMRTFLEALPGLGKTPGGNDLIAQTLDQISQHKIAAAEIASKAMSGEMSAKEAEKALRELPDPLELWKKNKGAAAAGGGGWQDIAPGVRIREKQ